jgi:restriction endonuclease Mrr
MPIPDFQSIMLPLLKILADGKVYKYREIFEALVREFLVTEAERKEREHLTCAMSINAYSSQKLENLEPDHKEK